MIAADGSYSYQAPANYHGSDSVDYVVTDGSASDTGTLTLTVTPVNDAPVATDDAVTVAEDQLYSSSTSLIANDSDVDGPALSAGSIAPRPGPRNHESWAANRPTSSAPPLHRHVPPQSGEPDRGATPDHDPA